MAEAAGGKVTFQLLWKGSRDNFKAATFHSKCDRVGPTVTVILSTKDKVFGGYTSEPWGFDTTGKRAFKYDPTAFVYSLTHKAKCATQKDQQYSIADNSSLGPCFGYGHDIYIGDSCNTYTGNYCAPVTYELPAGADSQTFLAGSYNYTVKEIEVYAVIKQ